MEFSSNFETVMRIAKSNSHDPPTVPVLCHADRVAGVTVEHRVSGATKRCQHCGCGWWKDEGASEGAMEELVTTLIGSN